VTEPVPVQRERERAVELAYAAIDRRERTVAELRAYLENERVGPASIEAAVEELQGAGYLDDASYARRFAEDKRQLERWGSERIARDLRRRGIEPALVSAAVDVRRRDDELAAAVEVLLRRLPQAPGDDRERDRAWRLLVRRGYEPELAYEAVRRLANGGSQAGRRG
jgi:regulatory protein